MNKLVRGLLWTIGVTVLVGLILRATIVDVWKVPSDGSKFDLSLEPTISAGDTVLVLTRGEPAFAELVRCRDKDDPTQWVVGRVAGLASDVVETNGAELTVAGKTYRGEMACAEQSKMLIHPVSGEEVKLSCDQVQMGGVTHMRGFSGKVRPAPTRTQVGAGMVFLLSDDRSYHFDSRDFGTVDASTCKGRIFFRLWSAQGFSDDKARFTYIR